MDIGTSKQVTAREDEGTVVHLKNEQREKQYFGEKNDQPVTITVAGTYSSRYRRAQDGMRDRALKRRGRDLEGDELYQQGLELTAACILDWQGITANGQPYPFSKANAIALLDACPWIKDQVEEAMNDHARFFKAS